MHANCVLAKNRFDQLDWICFSHFFATISPKLICMLKREEKSRRIEIAENTQMLGRVGILPTWCVSEPHLHKNIFIFHLTSKQHMNKWWLFSNFFFSLLNWVRSECKKSHSPTMWIPSIYYICERILLFMSEIDIFLRREKKNTFLRCVYIAYSTIIESDSV